MIEQLRAVYPTLLVYDAESEGLDEEYQWFITDDNDVLGIHKKELTAKDILLLNAFLSPYNINFPLLTKEEQRWKQTIHGTADDAGFEDGPVRPYRFVYFSISQHQVTPAFFRSALQELFERRIVILWENEHEGILIEEKMQPEDSTSYEQIIDILMSDLYVKIKFFTGPFQDSRKAVRQYYETIKRAAARTFAYSDKAVLTYTDAVPFLVIEQVDAALRREISQAVLQEYIGDRETLKMIEVLTHCNLNVSEAAKELHLHRNSLQYRLDRFHEKTGIDIRQFHQAMAVYLALLAEQ